MREHAAQSGRLRNFGSVTHKGAVAKYLSEGREAVSCEKHERVQKRWEEGLCSVGFSLEVRIRNESPTFNTAHLAGVVFFSRDVVGDQTTMSTGTGWAHWEGLWYLCWFFWVHGAPLERR
jgi:hypothetical protein